MMLILVKEVTFFDHPNDPTLLSTQSITRAIGQKDSLQLNNSGNVVLRMKKIYYAEKYQSFQRLKTLPPPKETVILVSLAHHHRHHDPSRASVNYFDLGSL
jgi:hypothetical protein